MDTSEKPKRNVAKIDELMTGEYAPTTLFSDSSGSTFASFLATSMAIVGFLLLTVGLIVGIILTSHTNSWGSEFFDRHDYAYIGIPLISSAFTFGLPFAAVGAYMSARLRGMKG
jgi:hypothetical protein